MRVAERLCRLSRIRLQETPVRMRQVHHQKVDLALDTTNHCKCLTKVSLGMTRRMRQGHEHLPLTLSGRKDVVLHDREAAGEIMLIAKPLKNPP